MFSADEAYTRANLISRCMSDRQLSLINNLHDLPTPDLFRLLNKKTFESFNDAPVILSKALVKAAVQFTNDKFPQSKTYLRAENIQVRVCDNERYCMETMSTSFRPTLTWVVARNLLMEVLGTTLDSFEEEVTTRLRTFLDSSARNGQGIAVTPSGTMSPEEISVPKPAAAYSSSFSPPRSELTVINTNGKRLSEETSESDEAQQKRTKNENTTPREPALLDIQTVQTIAAPGHQEACVLEMSEQQARSTVEQTTPELAEESRTLERATVQEVAPDLTVVESRAEKCAAESTLEQSGLQESTVINKTAFFSGVETPPNCGGASTTEKSAPEPRATTHASEKSAPEPRATTHTSEKSAPQDSGAERTHSPEKSGALGSEKTAPSDTPSGRRFFAAPPTQEDFDDQSSEDSVSTENINQEKDPLSDEASEVESTQGYVDSEDEALSFQPARGLTNGHARLDITDFMNLQKELKSVGSGASTDRAKRPIIFLADAE